MENAHRICLPVNITAQEVNSIQFGNQDRGGVVYPNDSPLVIKAKIIGVIVYCLLVDNGAFFNFLIKSTLDELGDFTDYVEPYEHIVKGFADVTMQPYGVICLVYELVSTLDENVRAAKLYDFLIIDLSSTFSSFLGRPFEHDIEVAPYYNYNNHPATTWQMVMTWQPEPISIGEMSRLAL